MDITANVCACMGHVTVCLETVVLLFLVKLFFLVEMAIPLVNLSEPW